MCVYCERQTIVKSSNFCGSAKMRINEGKEFNILEIYGDEKKFNIFKRIYQPRFDIYYCPMCGRKLGEKYERKLLTGEAVEIGEYFNEIEAISKKYNLSISHEDCQGSFVIEFYKEINIKWLKSAIIDIKGEEQ